MIDWSTILADKAFWIYYLRLFQSLGSSDGRDQERGRVAACCAFFGVRESRLSDAIVKGLYQAQSSDEPATLHTLCLPSKVDGVILEIEFQPYGPNEHIRITAGRDAAELADVDVDDVTAPLFWLHELPRIAARLHGRLAEQYGALLLYKLSAISTDDDLNALADTLQAALPSNLFSAREEARIIAISRRHWETAQRHGHPLIELEHPLARRWLGR